MPDIPSSRIECETIACPLCGVGEFRHVMTSSDLLHGIPGEFTVVRCDSCRHEYTNPQPAEASLSLCYPSGYGPHRTPTRSSEVGPNAAGETPNEETDPQLDRPWYLNRFVRRIPGLRALYYWLTETKGTFIPDVDNDSPSALELGCATGQFLQRLRDSGWRTSGVELVPEAAERARQSGFDVHTGDLASASLKDSSFDAVFAWMVIEHLTTPRDVLERIHQLLNTDGWLVFSVPNVGCWQRYVFGRYWYGWELPRHLQHFRPRTLKRLLESTGFDRVQIVHQPNLYYVIGSIGHWLKRWCPRSQLARRLAAAPDDPTLFGLLLLALPARLMSSFRQGERLTIVCRRSDRDGSSSPGPPDACESLESEQQG